MKATGIVTPTEDSIKQELIAEKFAYDALLESRIPLGPIETPSDVDDSWLDENPMDRLTDLERAEYDAWSEAQDALTPDPTICKCGKLHGDYSYPEGYYHLCDKCVPDDYEPDDFPIPDDWKPSSDYQPHMPFDEESDYDPDIPFLDEPISRDIEEIVSENESHKRLFQAAKAKFETLNPFSRPYSLTRRKEMLIARYSLRGTYTPKLHDYYIQEYKEHFHLLFDLGCTIHKVEIDRKKHLRVWFEISPAYSVTPDNQTHQQWLAERNNGGY